MHTALEIFFLSRIVEGFHYVRKELNITHEKRNPDEIVTGFSLYFFSDSRTIAQKHRYILHSTSWRYQKPDTLLLTYLVYADTFSFSHLNPRLLRQEDIAISESENPRIPRPHIITEESLVSHGIRHLSFLITNDKKNIYRSMVSPETVTYFTGVEKQLAGELG